MLAKIGYWLIIFTYMCPARHVGFIRCYRKKRFICSLKTTWKLLQKWNSYSGQKATFFLCIFRSETLMTRYLRLCENHFLFCLFFWFNYFFTSLLFILFVWFCNNQRNSKCEQCDFIKSVFSFPSKSPVLQPVGTFRGLLFLFILNGFTHILFLYLGLISRHLCIFQLLFWDRIWMVNSGEN